VKKNEGNSCWDPYNDFQRLGEIIEQSPFEYDSLICGGANGVDSMAVRYANLNDVEIEIVEADWDLGNGAGPIRNQKMAKKGDALIAIWDGESSGTRDMIDKALAEGLSLYVVQV